MHIGTAVWTSIHRILFGAIPSRRRSGTRLSASFSSPAEILETRQLLSATVSDSNPGVQQTAVVFGGVGTSSIGTSGSVSSGGTSRIVANSGGWYVDLTVQPTPPSSTNLSSSSGTTTGAFGNGAGAFGGQTGIGALALLGAESVTLNRMGTVHAGLSPFGPAINVTNVAMTLQKLTPEIIALFATDGGTHAEVAQAASSLVKDAISISAGVVVGDAVVAGVGPTAVTSGFEAASVPGAVIGAVATGAAGVAASNAAEAVTKAVYEAVLDKPFQEALTWGLDAGNGYISDVQKASNLINQYVAPQIVSPVDSYPFYGPTATPTRPELSEVADAVVRVTSPLVVVSSATPLIGSVISSVNAAAKSVATTTSPGKKAVPEKPTVATKPRMPAKPSVSKGKAAPAAGTIAAQNIAQMAALKAAGMSQISYPGASSSVLAAAQRVGSSAAHFSRPIAVATVSARLVADPASLLPAMY